MTSPSGSSLCLFTACPASAGIEAPAYLSRLGEVARWSERCGCTGALVYTDNSLIDPWLVAQAVLQHTAALTPLVAVQPLYMHPYTVAKLVATMGYLHGRAVALNMVAGGFANDLHALNDQTPHDLRYARLVEYTTVIMRLLRERGPVSHAGRFYTVDRVKLSPPLPAHLTPDVFVSGSSDAGLAAAAELDAVAVKYPKASADEAAPATAGLRCGLRLGIIARDRDEDAWCVARARFPEDRRGQLTHQLAMQVSDSAWHRELSAAPSGRPDSPYWLVPFHNYKTTCPYLVGSHGVVGEELARYIGLGYRTFILDVPPSLEDLEHATVAFSQALEPVLS